MTARLATATVTSRHSGMRGRSIVSAKGHHFIVDSPLNLGGPNEEVNPLDLLLAALATHVTFVCERSAQEADIPLESITVSVSGDFDPRGSRGDAVTPYVQAIRVRLALSGPSQEQVSRLVEMVQTRCLIYTTLARATSVEIDALLEPRLAGEASSSMR